MKRQIILPFTKSKYYYFGELIEGVNKIFSNVWTPKGWENRIMYIYIHNQKPISNTFDQRFDSCKNKFNVISSANGDYSKLTFECKHKLEII
jgi:hypothetical protein